jgi:hypothetical protein
MAVRSSVVVATRRGCWEPWFWKGARTSHLEMYGVGDAVCTCFG